jgi:hypothetical protein
MRGLGEVQNVNSTLIVCQEELSLVVVWFDRYLQTDHPAREQREWHLP